jgi:hypothetical protein
LNQVSIYKQHTCDDLFGFAPRIWRKSSKVLMLMPITPDDLTQEQIDRLFPLRRAPIKAGAFEIGLVLAGNVSAGGYTAGVLDYLIEACDAWTRAKDDGDPEMPTHEVIISTIAGASGGDLWLRVRASGRF